jgi:hypothetical protein
MSDCRRTVTWLRVAETTLLPSAMATLLPPPKRRKLYHGVPEPELKPAPPVPNIVVQFVNEEDGKALAPAVNLPANLSREGLEKLLNKLSRQVTLSHRFSELLSDHA